jgi:sugar O-acyltransferase (sialic acid O-acetyltransferase NeuD family)
MPRGLVIFGCGGQGREIAAIAMRVAQASGDGPKILGFVDDDPSPKSVERVEALGLQLLGTSDVIATLPHGTAYVVGIADGVIRERLAAAADRGGMAPATLVHPDASVGPACELGAGTVLWAGARLSANVSLGRHIHVNQNVTIGHDTVAGDFATLNPAAAVSGSVGLGRRCLVGAGSVVLQGLKVGDDAVVGASACVTRDVPASSTRKGVPAK